jgi:hypothetical protein
MEDTRQDGIDFPPNRGAWMGWLLGLPFGFSTAGDAANGLLFGWDIATLQKWALIYLGLSSLAFVVVWVVGYLRRG